MIISASRRTDIPCFYSDWFMNRIYAGYVITRNPINRKHIGRIMLNPSNVDCFVFWTKDPENMLDKLPFLDKLGYNYYFQFTLTPYNKTIETGLRDKIDIIKTFKRLSDMIGKNRILWRYDPIIINEKLDITYHIENFELMCKELHLYTNRVTISFVDSYKKIKTNAVREITNEEINLIAKCFSEIAKKYGLLINMCCENIDLTAFDIHKLACIDKNLIEQMIGCSLSVKSDKSQRVGCQCCESVDIGAYDSCKNGCVYCYANVSKKSIDNNILKHNTHGELLIGEIQNDEIVKDRKNTTKRKLI